MAHKPKHSKKPKKKNTHMPTFVRPDGDQTVGNWTPTPSSPTTLWDKIDETPFSDTDFVQSENDPSNDIMEVTLENQTTPPSTTGLVVRYRLARNQSGGGQPGTLDVIVGLYQDTTLIATATHSNIGLGFAGFSFTLSVPEADNITDYDDLRIRFDANKSAGARTTWCELSHAEFETPSAVGTLEQIHFRMRPTGADSAINADTGGDWAFAEDTSGTLALLDEYPLSLRIRFQVQAVGGPVTEAYELWYDKDAAASYSLIPNQSAPWTTSVIQNEVMLVPSLIFSEAAATTELLTTGTFVAGEGRHSEPTGSIVLTEDDITEIEFCVLIRKWSGDGHVPDASTFDFRVRKSDGTVLDTYDVTPRVTIGNKAGHIGGAMPETPSDFFIVEDTGVLYAVIEAHDLNDGTVGDELVVMKSTDGGDTWTAPDFANRPGSAFNDIEAIDVQYIAANDRLYIVWQESTNVRYVEFNTSGHASPDEYGTVETVDSTVTATVLVGQCVAFRRRLSDGVAWVVYADNDGTDDRVSLKKRTSGGTWDGSPTDLDGEASQHVSGGWMEIDSSNIIHLTYMVLRGTSTDADLYHRSINTSETLSGRTAINDVGTDMEGNQDVKSKPHAPPRIYDDGGTEKIGVAFSDTSEILHFSDSDVGSISFAADQEISTTAVAASAGGSAVSQHALMWDDTDDEPIVLFAQSTDDTLLRHITRVTGSWTGEVTELDGTFEIGWVRGRVFTHSSPNGSDRVVGYIYDEHLNPGGTGGIAYREIVRAVGGVAVRPPFKRKPNILVRM